MSYVFSGAGPGARTRDGCSVELYRKLPYVGDLDSIRELFMPGASVLELGCGTGRLTRKLLEWGSNVTAIDDSAEMLEHIPPDAVRVQSTIATLQLEKTFDTVLLASCLINHPSLTERLSLVAAARRHVARAGQLLAQRQDPQWLDTVQVGRVAAAGQVELFVESVSRMDRVVEMTLRYELRGTAWRHSFAVVPLHEAEIEHLCCENGFHWFEWFGPDRRWIRAKVDPMAASSEQKP